MMVSSIFILSILVVVVVEVGALNDTRLTETCPEVGIDYEGDDINSCGIKTESWQKCSEECRKNVHCLYWTWGTNDFKTVSWRTTCCLKNAKSGRRIYRGCISGSKQCGKTGGCKPGYKCTGCEDINECLNNNGGCNQECINTPGSYHCACEDGYVLGHDKKTCQAYGYHEVRKPSYTDACDEMVTKLKNMTECGQVYSIDVHNNGPTTDAIISAHWHLFPHGAANCTIHYEIRNEECAWNDHYQWAGARAEQLRAEDNRIISITNTFNSGNRGVTILFYEK